MQNKDNFDDPESAGIFAGIVRALDARRAFAARRPLWVAGMVVATAAVLGAVLYYAYPREAAQQDEAGVLVIRADAGELKVAPDDPGGMDIPHRESVVFDTLGGAGEERRVENLLPPAETPLPRAEMFAGLKTEEAQPETPPQAAADAQATGEPTPDPQSFDEIASFAPPEEDVTPAPETVASVAAAETVPAPAPAGAVTAEAVAPAPAAEDVAKTEPAAGLSLAAKEVAKGTHFVQLASVKDEAAAKAEWKKFQAAHSVLQPLSLHIQRADLGAKGVFYRIQGGPVPEADAKQICQAIQVKKPGGCFVVKE